VNGRSNERQCSLPTFLSDCGYGSLALIVNANGSYETQATVVAPTAEAMPPCSGSRRRGTALLAAIHAAVLAELSEGSMGSLTMERIAERARTGKAALYRRWPSREALIIDTLKSALPAPPLPHDEGSVRDQLVSLLGEMTATLSGPEGALARHILAELPTSEPLRATLMERLVQPRMKILIDVLAAGARRGEVRPDAVSATVAQVGPSVLLYRFFVVGAISFSDAVGVVDQVLMPLIRP
jgi:AcrR family transcriptional regulator